MIRPTPACIAVFACSAVAVGQDVDFLPLGDPGRAYLVASAPPGTIYDCAGGKVVVPGVAWDADDAASAGGFEAFIADLAGADVVVIGENHTSMHGHRVQWRIVRALAERGAPIAVALEFFESHDDPALARYVEGQIDLAQMLEETDWYGGGAYNFEYYRPMVDAAQEWGFPVAGLNVPRDLVRAVSRGGAGALTPEQRALVGDPGPVDARHRYLIARLMGDVAAAMPEMFDSMYRGQTTWDSAMAASILRARAAHAREGRPRTIIAVVGSGHMAHGLGIPARLAAADPTLRIRTLAPVTAEAPDPEAVVHPGFEKRETAGFSRGLADYVYVLPSDTDREEFPLIGARLGHAQGAASPTGMPPEVLSVSPGSVAERAGLRRGDRLLAIDREQVTAPADARLRLAALRWGTRVEVRVQRAGHDGELSLGAIIMPATDGDTDWLKSRIDSRILDDFDPRSSRVYAEPPRGKPAAPASVHARLVRHRDKAVRIDIMRGGRLIETWALDERGRPVLGLLAEPAADRAVRVELIRDEHGKVTGERRYDGWGEELGEVGGD